MSFRTQSAYTEEIIEVLEDLDEDGVTVAYYTNEAELHGQGVNVDDRVQTKYYVDVLFLRSSRRRDGGRYLPNSEVEVMMGAQSFTPKEGDYLIKPGGKRYPVVDVEPEEPDGFPIYYTLICIDG